MCAGFVVNAIPDDTIFSSGRSRRIDGENEAVVERFLEHAQYVVSFRVVGKVGYPRSTMVPFSWVRMTILKNLKKEVIRCMIFS